MCSSYKALSNYVRGLNSMSFGAETKSLNVPVEKDLFYSQHLP